MLVDCENVLVLGAPLDLAWFCVYMYVLYLLLLTTPSNCAESILMHRCIAFCLVDPSRWYTLYQWVSLFVYIPPFLPTSSQLSPSQLAQPCCRAVRSFGGPASHQRRPYQHAPVTTTSLGVRNPPCRSGDGGLPKPTHRPRAILRDCCRPMSRRFRRGPIGASPSCWSTCPKVRRRASSLGGNSQ